MLILPFLEEDLGVTLRQLFPEYLKASKETQVQRILLQHLSRNRLDWTCIPMAGLVVPRTLNKVRANGMASKGCTLALVQQPRKIASYKALSLECFGTECGVVRSSEHAVCK